MSWRLIPISMPALPSTRPSTGNMAFQCWLKVGLDVALTLVLTPILTSFARVGVAVACSFLLAHTLSWLLNTHFFVIGRFVGFTTTPTDKICSYARGIASRSQRCPALLGVAVYGAVARGRGVRATSDVDMRFI